MEMRFRISKCLTVIILILSQIAYLCEAATTIGRTLSTMDAIFLVSTNCVDTKQTAILYLDFGRSDLQIQSISNFKIIIGNISSPGSQVTDVTFTASDIVISGQTVTITNALKKMQSSGCLTSGGVVPQYIELIYTISFLQAGSFTLTLKIGSVQIGSGVSFEILPDTFASSSLDLNSSASVTVSGTGSYTLKFTPLSPMGYFDKVVFTIVETWDPDQAVTTSCKSAILASPNTFASTSITGLSVALDSTITTTQNLLKYSSSVTSQLMTNSEYTITFKMNNPYSVQPIIFSSLIELKFELFFAGEPIMETDFGSLTFSLLTAKSYNCLSPITAKLSCLSGSTYSNANCAAGDTVDIRIEITPTVFMESYSSVDVYIIGVPQQTPVGASLSYSLASSMSKTGIASSLYSSSPITYLASFNQFNPYVSTSNEYVCINSSYYLQLNFPSFSLPIDIQGLQLTFQFFTQPYTSTINVRDTSSGNKLQNAGCSDTTGYYSIPQNYLDTASVTTTNSLQLQVGKTDATHSFKLISSFTFTSSIGRIELTFPSKSTPGTTPTCVLTMINSLTSSTYSASTTSCSTSGSVVTIDYTFSSSTTINGFTFTIYPISNSLAIEYSGEFSVQTYYKKYYLSETNVVSTTFGYTTSPAPFQSVTVSTTQKTVFDTAAVYTLIVTPSVQLVSGDFLGITFPSPVTSISSVSLDATTFTSSIAAPVLTLTVISTWAIGVAKTITVTIKNPPVINKDYSYNFEAYKVVSSVKTSFLYQSVQYGAPASYVTKAFSTASLTPTTSLNSDPNVYTLSFMPSVALDAGSNLYLTFTSSSSHSFLPSTVVCSGSSTTCTTNSPSTNQLTISFSGSMAQSSSQTISLTTVTNYLSLAPVSVTVQLGYLSTQIGNEQTLTIANSISAKRTDTTMSIADAHLGVQTTYTFNFSGFLPFPSSSSYIKVTSPSLMSFDNTVTNPVIINSLNCGSVVYTTGNTVIKASCTPSSSTVSITIAGVDNPVKLVSATTDAFKIATYETVSGVDYLIKEFSSTSSPLVYTNACDITYYCDTCSSYSICLTCFAAGTIQYSSSSSTVTQTILDQSTVTTSTAACVTTCPSGAYQIASSGIQTCQKCDSNCLTCSTTSTTCLTCSSAASLYLNPLTSTCVSTCPTNYYKGSSNVCIDCTLSGHCSTCTAASVCTACQTGYLLEGSSCVTTCSTGYYNSGSACTICTTGCSACTSATVCTACSSTYIFYNNSCVTSCPTGQSPLLISSVLTCGTCDSNCNTCKTLTTTCTSCNANTYLYGTTCIVQSAIPQGYYGDKSSWVVAACMNYCKSCTYASACDTCISSAVIYSGVCYLSCPDKAPISDGNGGCTTSSTISTLNDSSRIIPFPMLLSCIAFSISVYFSKYEKPQTFVPGCIVGFCSFFEWISWIILIAITYINDGINFTTILAILGFVLIYVFNIICFILFRRSILLDTSFVEWKAQPKNSTCFKIVFILSLIFSFKMQKIVFCKYFNQNFFKAKLKDIDLFSPFNKIAILSVVFNSFLIILSSAVFGYNYQTNTQLFILSLDTLFVTLFLILFMIWEALKNGNFFDENYNLPSAYDSQQSRKFFPLDQSDLDNVGRRSVYGHLKKDESNSNLNAFSEDQKAVQEEPLQKPMSDVMNPNEFSNNANIDRNMLKNAESGAPYVIEDEISESSKPGKKRQYEKIHIQPIFNEKDFPVIEENSLEDEDDDYFDDPRQSTRQRMKPFDKSKSIQDVSGVGGPNVSDDFYGNPSNIKGNTSILGPSKSGAPNVEMEEMDKPDGSERTIFYDQQNPNELGKSVGPRVSTGVGISRSNYDGHQLQERLKSKPDDNKSKLKKEPLKVNKYPDEDEDDYPLDEETAAGQNPDQTKNPNGKLKGSGADQKGASPSQDKGNKDPAGVSNGNQKDGSPAKNGKLEQSGNPNAKQGDDVTGSAGAGQKSPHASNNKKGVKDGIEETAPSSTKKLGDVNNNKLKAGGPEAVENTSGLYNPSINNNNSTAGSGTGNNTVSRILPNVEDLDENNKDNLDKSQNKSTKGKDISFKTPMDRGDKNALEASAAPSKSNTDKKDNDKGKLPNSKKDGKSDANNSKVRDIGNIFDSDESLRSASEAEVNFNEVSPSDFNALNQRYEDDYFSQQPPSSALVMQQQQSFMNATGRSYQTNSGIKTSYIHPETQYINGSERGRSSSRILTMNESQNKPNNMQSSPSSKSVNQDYGVGGQKSQSPTRKIKNNNGNLLSSRSQNVNGLSVDQKPPLNAKSQQQKGQPYNPSNQLVIENFDDYSDNSHYLGSQSASAGIGQVSSFIQPSVSQDSGTSSLVRGNSSNSRSRINTPVGTNVVYKSPAVDPNKLKSLEKIYLQRIESNLNSQQSSRSNSKQQAQQLPSKKKKKAGSQINSSQNSNLQVNKTSKNPSDMQDIYFGEQNGNGGAQEVFDFDYDEEAQ